MNRFVYGWTWFSMPQEVQLVVWHLFKARNAPNRWAQLVLDPLTFLSDTSYIKRVAAGKNVRPRVFLSYRHGEVFSGKDSSSKNSEHQMWVSQFAHDLEAWGIEVIWDYHMRELLRSRSKVNPDRLLFSAEISRICPVICQVFIPILTPGYLARIGYADGGHQTHFEHGAVFEEWQQALWLNEKLCMDLVLVARAGEQRHYENLPSWFKACGIYDLRPENTANYASRMKMVVTRILRMKRQDPAVSMDLTDWVGLYIDWCRANVPERTSTPIERWLWRMDLPSDFLGDLDKVKSRIAAEG